MVRLGTYINRTSSPNSGPPAVSVSIGMDQTWWNSPLLFVSGFSLSDGLLTVPSQEVLEHFHLSASGLNVIGLPGRGSPRNV